MIIVFGSLNIDMVMQVDHFPTAGETVLCPNDYLSRAGGKGANQAVAAVRAGGKVAMVGKVGDDSFGRRSINNLKHQSILTAGIGISERPTGCAMIAVNQLGHNQVITAPSANIDTTSDQIPDEILTPRNTVLTQLEVHPLETASVLSRAKKGGARTILNASPISARHKLTLEMLQNVDYLIVNEVESRQLAEHLNIHEADHVKRARALSEKGQLTAIITLEDKGAIAATPKETWQVDALTLEPVDTTGAGDTFCGIFASCLEAGFDLPASLHRASVGASMSCLGIGAQEAMPFMEEILAEMTKIAPPQLI